MKPRTIARFCTALMLFAALDLAGASSAMAGQTFTYAGGNFDLIIDNTPPAGATYTVGDSVTGTLTVTTALAANLVQVDITANVQHYSMSDGVNTHTENNSSLIAAVLVSTDAGGNITQWQIKTQADVGFTAAGDTLERITTTELASVFDLDSGLLRECITDNGAGTCTSQRSDIGQLADTPGIWTIVPEPSTALLLASGLLGIAGARKRRL